ncbi:MAG: DNAase [Verrucomicrobiales bacterium]|nr:DNAase [Verrucomicrobiales bacterium]|tara:strand:- start:1052 stop:1858 length:807 start_codon:yes stop_codon:yes gene_type:complete
MTEFYDTHAHLTFPDFAEEIDQVLSRAADAGITRIVTIGTDLDSSRRAVALAEKHEGIYAVVGWHPNDLESAPDDVCPDLRELCAHEKVVAIGETGIDHYRLPSSRGGSVVDDAVWKERQIRVFRQQLDLAVELKRNVVIHQRVALKPTLEIFEQYASRVRGQFHCFVDDVASMQRVVELGSLISFTGILTFKNAKDVRETLAATPEDRFMLETDSPFLAPVPYRGKRCEPAYVKEIAAIAAEVRGCSLKKLSGETCATARDFFKGLN